MELHSEDLSAKAVKVVLSGRLDTLGVDQVEAKFNAVVISRGLDVLVDLTGVSFISSMGIRMLIAAARGMRLREARLVLFGAQALVHETLQSMAIDTLIAVVATEQEGRTIVRI